MKEARDLFIGVAGIIGAGKSNLTAQLAQHIGSTPYYENAEENIYLKKFYKNMWLFAFPMQVYLLSKRFEQHQRILWSGRGAVQDRTIYEDTVFAKMLYLAGFMGEMDYQTYIDLFNLMANFMRKPDLIIYLDVQPEISLQRIQERDREGEQRITLQYLQALHEEYEVFLDDISQSIPILRLDWNEFGQVKKVAELIEIPRFSYLKQSIK